jgi:hypothetical protein
MHTSSQCSREAHIAGHDENKLVGPADPGEIPPKRPAVRGIVMPEHHTADPLWQAGDGWARIGQPHRIGE